ncbi:MAG: hypothetical protein WBC91_21950 [Phototrophicaceae bacterium]
MRRLLALLLIFALMIGSVVAQEDDDDLDEIARYSIDEAGNLTLISGDEDESHDDLWILMLTLLPTDYVSDYLTEFAVFFSEDTLAYVSEIEEDSWEFGILLDDDPERALTVIHEFGHIIALNNTQYETYPTVIADMEEPLSDDDYYDGIEEDMEDCDTIAFDDGCPISGSYLELFTYEFWTEEAVELIVYEELDDSAAYFFDENPDAFVSEYAATNPIEDFAESFSYFIGLDDDDFPDADSDYEMDAKILWFEQFPELIEMRESIRGNAEVNDITFEFSEDSNYFE